MSEPKKTESFAGNVMKYSIATYLGFGISGAALIIKGVLPAESYAVHHVADERGHAWAGPKPAALLPRTACRFHRAQHVCRVYPAFGAGHAAGGRHRQHLFRQAAGGGLWPWGQRCRAGAVFVPERCSVHAGALPQRAAPAGKQCARLHHRNAVDAGLPEPDLPAARLCYPGRPRFCAGCGVQLCGGRSVLLAAGF